MAKEEINYKPALTMFPSEGVCYNHNKDLFDFLMSRLVMKDSKITYEPNDIGLAWSSSTIWFVKVSSSKPEYTMEQLYPFIPHLNRKEPELTWAEKRQKAANDYPKGTMYKNLTENEDPEVLTSNGIIAENSAKTAIWVQGHPGYVYLNGKWAEIIYKEALPEKWCVKITPENNAALLEFIRERSEEYKGCRDPGLWSLTNGYYLFYPQPTSGMHSSNIIRSEYGHILIDDIQLVHIFSKHNRELQTTNINLTLEQDGTRRNTIEVQRPDLSVSRGGTIRAAGIRCPDSEITVRSGHSPNKTGPIKG